MSARADLHCHSSASQLSKLGVQRALGLPECATPPEEVHALAKRRGMDFVTITDHDTIDGVLKIADRPDVFISEELTARFRGEPQAVHVLCWGITPEDHDWLRALSGDVEAVAAYLRERRIASALAHPFFAVEAPLLPRHRRRLTELFDVWETRNGARAPELNEPAAVYAENRGTAAVGGSDDHAGVDIGRTWTETPPAATPDEFLDHVRAGRVSAAGAQGSAAKWTHAAMALALRALGRDAAAPPPDPVAVLRMVQRVVRDADARGGALATGLTEHDARAVLGAWLSAVDLDLPDADVLEHLQGENFSHERLYRRARRRHERALQVAVGRALEQTADAGGATLAQAALGLFEASVAAVPYAPATAFLGRERRRLPGRAAETPRVALIADGIGSMHGVTHTVEQIREHGVPGFEVEVVGTDRNVDRRLGSVAEVEFPYYAGLQLGIPALPDVVEALAAGGYGLVHACSPGPVGVMGGLVARMMQVPSTGSYHTELAAYARLRSAGELIAGAMGMALGAFYGACDVVLSPSASADAQLAALGVEPTRVARWSRGVDTARFAPSRREGGRFGGPAGQVTVLHAGRLATEKGVDLLADAFLCARARDPRLHLVVAGGGPEEERLRARLGGSATFLGWLEGEALAVAYASADLFLFCSQNDTFGQVVQEAQASGLPVVAVAAGGPAELVEDGRTGVLCPPRVGTLADAVCALASSPAARRRLARGGLDAVRDRTWDASLEQLAAGWRVALTGAGVPVAAAA